MAWPITQRIHFKLALLACIQGRQCHRRRRGWNILCPPKFVIVVFIIVNIVLNVHTIWRSLMIDAINASKCTDLHVTIQNFPGGYAPNPHVGEGLWRPFSNSIPSVLRRCAPSAPRSGLNRAPMFVSRWLHCLYTKLDTLCYHHSYRTFSRTIVQPGNLGYRLPTYFQNQ